MSDYDRYGFYEVDGKIYKNKVLALEAAGKTEYVWPKFNFNEAAFSNFDWTVEPPFSLEEAYKLRAEQLREKYDYLVLYYSGGVDSHNILTTFIKNNIKIDSVVVYGTYDFDKSKSSRFNLELYNAAIPFAKKYEHLYDLKLIDISHSFDKYYNDDWIYQGGVQLAPYEYIMAYTTMDPYFQDLFSKGSVGIIRGVDKPRVFFHENSWYVGFLDHGVTQSPTVLTEGERMTYESLEYFYWTPDAPWIISKQAHIIKNYFENIAPHLKHLMTHTADFTYDTLERYVVPLIYDVGTTPGNKAVYYTLGKGGDSGPVFHHKDGWFHSSNIELKSQKIWHNGIQQVDRMLDSKYKNGGSIQNGMVGVWSKWYKI
jgi:hypothetical protein